MFRINFLWGISLTVFNSHHSTFKAKKRIKLTYSSAKVLRVLNEKTRSSRSGFEKYITEIRTDSICLCINGLAGQFGSSFLASVGVCTEVVF